MKKHFTLFLVFISAISFVSAQSLHPDLCENNVQSRTSVSQAGVTWTFDQAYTTGQFVNCDWWVIPNNPGGSVVITQITPQSTATTNLAGDSAFLAQVQSKRNSLVAIIAGQSGGASSSQQSQLNRLDEVLAVGRVRHGSMLNVGSSKRQGFDSSTYVRKNKINDLPDYNEDFNVAPGVHGNGNLALQSGDSLLSSISREDWGLRPQIDTVVILTVLGSQPPSRSFRPPYINNALDDSVQYNFNDLDYSILRNDISANVGGNAPTITGVANLFDLPWIDHVQGYIMDYMHPITNFKGSWYGEQVARDLGIGALMLNTDHSNFEKQSLYARYVQNGLDYYSRLEVGGTWPSNGGHSAGRKFPILLAGYALDNQDMKNIGFDYGPTVFHEDGQTFYQSTTRTGQIGSTGVYYEYDSNWFSNSWTSPHGVPTPINNAQFNLGQGIPEWGMRHWEDSTRDHAGWNPTFDKTAFRYYRVCCTARGWGGFILATKLMGLQSAWNHDALFDYMDRYDSVQQSLVDYKASTTGDAPENYLVHNNPWVYDMWNAYRPIADIQSVCGANGIETGEECDDGNTNSGDGCNSECQIEECGPSLPGVSCDDGLYCNGVETCNSNYICNSGSVPCGDSYECTIDSCDEVLDSCDYQAEDLLCDQGGSCNVGTCSLSGGCSYEAIPDCSCDISSSNWQSISLGNSENGIFTFEFESTPAVDNMDGVMGLSDGAVITYSDFSAGLRFYTNGEIEVYNGLTNSYSSDVPVQYVAGDKYSFRMVLDVPNELYDVYVSSPSQGEVLIANDYGFRNSASQIDTWNFISGTGNFDLCNWELQQGSAGGGSLKGVTPVGSGTPFYIDTGYGNLETNPVNCGNMEDGDACETTWTVRATGDAGTQWDMFAIANSIESGSVNSEIISVNILEEILQEGIVNVVSNNNPTLTVNQDGSFSVTYTATCTGGDCGVIDLTLDPIAH